MFFAIMLRVLSILLVILVFMWLINLVYKKFFEKHLTDNEVDDIIDEAEHNRVIKEAKKVANKIETEEFGEG